MPILKSVLKLLNKLKKKVWYFFDDFNNDSLTVVKSTDVIQKYIDYKVDDIEEFAAIYTYERHDVLGQLDDRQSKEKMFREVYKILLALEKKDMLDH